MTECTKSRKEILLEGARDGIPVALGYLAVSFSLGIAMKNAGMTAFQGFLISLVNLASAGEYADVQVIAADAAYFEIAVVTLVANARYLLMSTALSQKFSQKTPFFHRLFVGYGITDELFGLAIGRQGSLDPEYYYGALMVSVPGWAIGTALGVTAGNILPARLVSALSVALYGMFLAIIIPASKKDKAVAEVVCVSFLCSYLSRYIPLLNTLNSGTKTIVLTVIIAAAAAILKPHTEGPEDDA